MSEILLVLQAANGLSPLAIIGLLATAIILLTKSRREVQEKITTLTDNHLHDLPLLLQNSNRTVDTLQRIEIKLGELVAAINVRIEAH